MREAEEHLVAEAHRTDRMFPFVNRIPSRVIRQSSESGGAQKKVTIGSNEIKRDKIQSNSQLKVMALDLTVLRKSRAQKKKPQ